MDQLGLIRMAIMEATVERGQVPDARQVADRLGLDIRDVMAGFQNLHDDHVVVLEPGAPDRLRMANPFSSAPTPFRVVTDSGEWWGNCIWDGLGIIACLGGTGLVMTTCADCGEPAEVRIEHSVLASGECLAGFGVPAARWWDDIIFT